MKQIRHIDAVHYQQHMIHGEDRIWSQTNCYADLVIEQLHALGMEPIAALPFTVAIDFEGDQWTFFKFPDGDIYQLFGLDIQELAIWRPMIEHIEDQIALGHPVLVELDSFYLPDTAGTAYQLSHVKSTVGVNEIDVAARHLGYFHNQGYFTLTGNDFRDLFQLDGLVHERMLPPYVEYIKFAPGFRQLNSTELVEASKLLLKYHLGRVPQSNPFIRFKQQFSRDLEWLLQAEISVFHTYSFANLRQYGACFELTATYLQWLTQHGTLGLEKAQQAFLQIADTAKAFQFQLARSISRKKVLDLTPLDTMAAAWDLGMSELMPLRA